MYGLIGKLISQPGMREELIAILIDASADMPGNVLYVVAEDNTDRNTTWITEVWESGEAHEASLQLPAVKAAIERGRPLISQFDQSVEVTPVGGRGL